MKLAVSKFIISVILTLTVLALLRYRPWNSRGGATARDVIHEGSNTKALRELTVGYLPPHLPRNRFCIKNNTDQYKFQLTCFF